MVYIEHLWIHFPREKEDPADDSEADPATAHPEPIQLSIFDDYEADDASTT